MNQTDRKWMEHNVHVVLASASPRRSELLRQIGLEPEVLPSRVEEIVTSEKPDEVVTELSFQKAREVAARLAEERSGGTKVDTEGRSPERDVPDEALTVVIGSDTVVSSEGRILGKPQDREEAMAMLWSLQGKSHLVYTGVTLLCGTHRRSFAEQTLVEVYPMTEEEIAAYVDSGDSMDKAGAYGIQGCFAVYIKGIQGSYTNVMGLPVGRLYQELKQLLKEAAEERDD